MSEPLESALAWLRLVGDVRDDLGREYARALLAEIEWLRGQNAELSETNELLGSGELARAQSEVAELRARPTREQALRALESWATRPPGWTSPEDCLDAAMREGEA